MLRSTVPIQAHEPGQELHGFRIEQITELPDIKARAYEATHLATGAQVLHIHCHDEENLFSVGFRTRPSDSTGVAHIVEHCVTCGSERYPVKEAFIELRKRTLATFLNAITWPDRTIYPACSAVRADYFNLAAVYSGLVFNAFMRRESFQQEGHHLEFETIDDPSTPLKVRGIVYNEMKGALSSPEGVVHRLSLQELLPDTSYRHEAGGDPERIPELNYEDFVAFHGRFYCPSNARFLLYGNVSTEDNLAFLSGVLAPFERREIDSEIPVQPRWSEPRAVEDTYPVGKGDELGGKSFVSLQWMTVETSEVEESLELAVLGEALGGSAAGPVRRALVDSGLGRDVYPGEPWDADLRHGIMTFGLRGTDADKAEAVESIVLDTLRRVVEEGLDRELIEASLHQIEFQGREISPPFPIQLLVRANPPWYFGGDPKAGLRFASAIEQVRARHAQDPRLFEKLTEKWLLANPHRLRLTVRPSDTLNQEREAAHTKRMAQLAASLSSSELERIKDDALKLRERQQRPDEPSALASLPRLRPADIPRQVRVIPERRRRSGGVEVVEHEVFSNGVGYVGIDFDVRDLGDDETLLLPLVGRATLGLGAAGSSYQQMATRIGSATGGFYSGLMAGCEVRARAPFEILAIDGSMLGRNAGRIMGLLGELLLESDTSDTKRLKDLVLESAARLQASLIPEGHAFALRRAAAPLGGSFYRTEQWAGATQLRFIEALARDAEAEVDRLAQTLSGLQRRIFTRSRLVVHVAGDPELLEALQPEVDRFIEALPEGEPVTPVAAARWAGGDSGVVIAAPVNYVAQVAPVPDLLDPAAPALEMLAQVAGYDYLFQKLRVQGGAYGGFCLYRPYEGVLGLLSYRDPHLSQTFSVFENLAHWLEAEVSDEAVEACRLGAIGGSDRVLSPAEQLAVARRLRLVGVSDEDRNRLRDGLFKVSAADVRAAAHQHLAPALALAPRAAFGSLERLTEANEGLERKLELVTLSS